MEDFSQGTSARVNIMNIYCIIMKQLDIKLNLTNKIIKFTCKQYSQYYGRVLPKHKKVCT